MATDTAGLNVVVASSHRSRDRLARVLGGRSTGYYADILDPNDYHIIPDDKLDEVLRIKGISLRKRPPAKLYERWSSGVVQQGL